MAWTHILLRYGEIFLKGKNKPYFVKKLLSNIHAITGKKAQDVRSRFVMPYFDNHIDLKRVFGLTSYSLSVRVEKDIDLIVKQAALLAGSGSFKIATKRSDKSFPITSPDMNVQVGQYVESHSDATFSFDTPDVIIHIEINQEGAYLFTDKVPCFGGLPTGVEGKVELLVENQASLLAGLLFMKRGCTVIPVMKNDVDISVLEKYSPGQLVKKEKEEGNLLVSGQTFETLSEYDEEGTVFRPLIAYSDERIKRELERYTTL
ncbi:TPA: hypothetical protein HA278_06655 [Candidatus Woesearchaeota archaeon]|nr:hypothetical protein [Candidatus Woesearchaeota archaeon]